MASKKIYAFKHWLISRKLSITWFIRRRLKFFSLRKSLSCANWLSSHYQDFLIIRTSSFRFNYDLRPVLVELGTFSTGKDILGFYYETHQDIRTDRCFILCASVADSAKYLFALSEIERRDFYHLIRDSDFLAKGFRVK